MFPLSQTDFVPLFPSVLDISCAVPGRLTEGKQPVPGTNFFFKGRNLMIKTFRLSIGINYLNNEEKYFPFIKLHFLQPKLLKRFFSFYFLSTEL